ncbi:COBRA-like protein 4 [Capsicum annuum]|nr:COBRA-like protein 4 [Capsicum annuum]
MCPVRIHWHVKINYKEYWRVKITVTNFNYRVNYTQWTLVAQHPNLNNVTQVFSFDYKPLLPYQSINDTGMFYGMRFYNDLLMEAGPAGNVQSEVLLQKDKDTFTLKQGWAFPRKVYFNGDECMLPPPDTYPFLPNFAHQNLEVTGSSLGNSLRQKCKVHPHTSNPGFASGKAHPLSKVKFHASFWIRSLKWTCPEGPGCNSHEQIMKNLTPLVVGSFLGHRA